MAHLDPTSTERARDATQRLLLVAAEVSGRLRLASGGSARAGERDDEIEGVVASLAADTADKLKSLAHHLGRARETAGASETRLVVACLVEGAQMVGDLATVAACNAALLTAPDEAARVVVDFRGVAQEMQDALGEVSGVPVNHAVRDLRGAVWKSSFAVDHIQRLQNPEG